MKRKLLLFLTILLCYTSTTAQIYVAKNGNDGNAGTLASPYLTIQKAASVATAGQTVYVRTGTYRETVVPANSGSAGSPITFQPYNDEVVIISGADPITTAWTVHSGSIYKTAMAANWMDKSHNQSDQIFVNSSMVHLARWPNFPTSLDPSYPEKTTCTTFNSKSTNGNVTTGSLTAATAPPANSVGAEICVQPNNEGWSWIFSGILTAQSGGQITFTSFSGSGKDGEQNVYDPKSRYFLFNKLSLLDAPGEWYHDNEANELYLWAPNGANPGTTVEAKKREYAFNISNKNFITIKGFSLFACTITTDDISGGDNKAYDGSGNTQYPWRSAGNPLASSHNCIVDGINAKYLSHYTDVSGHMQFQWGMSSGIVISGQNHIIQNCTLDYSAGNGITLIGKKNKALYNTITNIDYSANECSAICTGGANITVEDNEIAYNTVRKTGRSGMTPRSNVNSSWTNFEARAHHNNISEFLIQDWDGAGIYVTGLGNSPYSMRYFRMDHNIVYEARGYQCAGLYTDYTSGVIIDHNLVYDVDIPVKVQGYDNTLLNNNTLIYNNTLICRKSVPATPYNSPYNFGNSSSHNGESNVGTVIKNNICLSSIDGGSVRSYQAPLASYETFQLFANAITTPNYLHAQGDPLFTNWAGLDFTLQANSGAVNKGETLTSIVRDGNTIPYFNDAVVGQIDHGCFEQGAAPWSAGADVRNVPVTGISIQPTGTVAVGLKLFLAPTFTPSNATNQSLTWSSSNNSIATVSSNGEITGIALGNCTITATSVDGNYSSTSNITVREYNINEHVIAINCGGGDFSTSAGILYKADVYSVGGNPATSGYFFSNTSDHDIYRAIRYGTDFSYRIPVVNNQSYKVTLNFTNWSGGAASDRGNVFAEGVQVLTNTDAFVASGNANLKAYDIVLNPFNVTDGFIDLRFVNTGTGNFSVCGISVVAGAIVTGTDNSGLSENELMVYPNPSDGPLSLTIKTEEIGNYVINISDVLGTKLYSKNFVKSAFTLDVSIDMLDFPAGIYNVEINHHNMKTQRKVVKY